ncbi:MAG TPA: hypothetical protein VD713_07720, partial [Sphingomonadales bacterium]|nr:hypothetical protein [Sphingomonadales bacterium]
MKRKNAAAMGRRDAPGGILQKILASKRREVDRLRIALDAKALERTVRPTPRRFAAALRRPGPGFIFEYKRGSPSLGQVSRDRPLGEVAAAYRPFADAVSVLTDREYFDGDFSDLAALRREVAQPILCKDFIIDEIQVLLARRAGADAILLILSSLTDRVYERLSRTARALDMDVLTEVHTADEMTRAGALGATLIGINNRNLSSLLVSSEVTRRLAPLAPAGAALVSESGIQTRRDIVHLAPLVDAFL